MASESRPLIALVGRANVGKSTLFNTLTRSRASLVSDMPGLTRDRNYGEADIGGRTCVMIDSGGLLRKEEFAIDFRVDEQVRQAVEEADILLFVVDGRDGLTAIDEKIAMELRKTRKPVVLVVNKSDFLDPDIVLADFHRLGMATLLAVAAEHRRGISALVEAVTQLLPEKAHKATGECEETKNVATVTEEGIELAVLGRPNAGKSTLLNCLIGMERLVVSPIAGTTRDAISVPYIDNKGDRFTLIDTAGIRRKARVKNKVEKFSIVKALEAIERANVVMLVLDAQAGIGEQDAHLLGEITRRGRALIIVINKWDHLCEQRKEQVRKQFDRKLHFVDYAQVFYISALHGRNVRRLIPAVKRVYRSAMAEISTNEWNQALKNAYRHHQPPMVNGHAVKLRYAHQGGKNPPHVIIHGVRTSDIPPSYSQYLSKYFRRAFALHGTPIRISYRDKAKTDVSRDGKNAEPGFER